MRIRLLGTGTPTPSLRRMCSGYVVEVGADTIVFDHGFGAHHRLLQLGIPPTQVTHFFCSHLHYDHMGDFPRLLLTRAMNPAAPATRLVPFGCLASPRCSSRPIATPMRRMPNRSQRAVSISQTS